MNKDKRKKKYNKLNETVINTHIGNNTFIKPF